MARKYVVYAIIHKNLSINNINPNEFKYMYIGYAQNFRTRMKNHFKRMKTEFKRSRKLYNRLRDHGWDAYDKIILKSNLTEEEAKRTETELIAFYNSYKQGLNSTEGGDGGNGIKGASHKDAKAVRIYNNCTKEVKEFSWCGEAALFFDVDEQQVRAAANPNTNSSQFYSSKFDAWLQARHLTDDTPFIKDMKTPHQKKEKRLVVINIDTKEEQEFNCTNDAASYFNAQRHDIANVLSGNCQQFIITINDEIQRYDAQYIPKTRDWNFDVLLPKEATRLKNSKAVIAFDESDVQIYEFDSITHASQELNISVTNISTCALHDTAFAGRTTDGQQLRWEYKDDILRAQIEQNKPRKPIKSKRIYYVDVSGKEVVFLSSRKAANMTHGEYSIEAQRKAIQKSINSNGTIVCKIGHIWFRKQ